jgi:hypothetical protein
MSPNPNPSRITEQLWWLWQRLHELEPASELGGIFGNKSGYHNTRNANALTNYSVRDWQDKQGPADKAAAIDWTFPDAQRGRYGTIIRYTSRLIAAKKQLQPYLREVYGQADGDLQVEGWDFRYGRSVSSDSSHLWHIHMSFNRGQVTNWAAVQTVYAVLSGGTNPQEEDMTQEESNLLRTLAWRVDMLVYDRDKGLDNPQNPQKGEANLFKQHLEEKLAAAQTPQINYEKLAAEIIKAVANK